MQMDGSPLDSLTAEQRECLRLVAYERLTSKEIARRLNRSKTAIDQRLDRARVALGAPDRHAAARAFLELQGSPDANGATRDQIIRDPRPLADPIDLTAPTTSITAIELPRLMQWLAAFEEVNPDDLSPTTRLFLILLCAAAFAMILGGVGIGTRAAYALLVELRALLT